MTTKTIAGTIMCDCGHMESAHSEITRGYGRDANGKTSCYDCCTQADKDALKDGTQFCGYISSDGLRLVNWPGFALGTVTHTGRVHNWTRNSFNGKRYYIRVRDCHGAEWYGTGAAGMYASLRKRKTA